eukprot:CAMPEP_0171166976 /NCGR_PEP_ID=MMETSP0790-20130122/6969_1 /TAXON_ID=2925 /ORGANISM="Alexandrium catenella, Strain OF101" /LENGTH=254 /DNA_ID=CAMNT_0011631795 /DNA_START=280 /DNA_END=1043 /DNA_ORIENTATION=+
MAAGRRGGNRNQEGSASAVRPGGHTALELQTEAACGRRGPFGCKGPLGCKRPLGGAAQPPGAPTAAVGEASASPCGVAAPGAGSANNGCCCGGAEAGGSSMAAERLGRARSSLDPPEDLDVKMPAELSTDVVCELLAVTREAHLPVIVQGVAQVINLCHVNVVKSQPLDIEEAAKAAEGVGAANGTAGHAAHAGIALERTTPVDGEDQDDSSAAAVRVIELLLVLPLRRPDAVLHGLHDILSHVARDDEVPCLG